MLSRLIKRFERGQHHRFVTLFNIVTNTRCLRDGTGQPPSIRIGDLFSSYVILILGFLGSMLLLMVS